MKTKSILCLALTLLFVGIYELIYQMIILFPEVASALIPRLTGIQS